MREPNLLVISNKLEKVSSDEGLEVDFVRWDCSPDELWMFLDYYVVIIDFSFDNDDELKKINPEIYRALRERLLNVIAGLIVLVICGYPNKKAKISVPDASSDESKYPGSQQQTYYDEDFEKVVIEERDSYRFLEGLPIGIYNRLTFEPSQAYDKKVKSPFKEYFNLADIAHLTFRYSPPLPDITIEPISRTGGVGRDRHCMAVLVQIEKGVMILLPGYVRLKKKEAFLSLIEISKGVYKKQQRLRRRQK